MLNFKPLADRVLIEQAAAEETTKSGIIIPEASREQPNKGTAIAVGPKCTDIKINDSVVYGEFAGVKVTVEEKDYLLMREDDIYAIVNKDEK